MRRPPKRYTVEIKRGGNVRNEYRNNEGISL